MTSTPAEPVSVSAAAVPPLPVSSPVWDEFDSKQLLRKAVSKDTVTDGHWLTQTLDLSSFAGQKVKLELVNQPTGWAYEAAYWAEIAVRSE